MTEVTTTCACGRTTCQARAARAQRLDTPLYSRPIVCRRDDSSYLARYVAIFENRPTLRRVYPIAMQKAEYPTLDGLLAAVRKCRVCEGQLPLGPRPVLRAGGAARILVVGQAPGLRVHTTGMAWDDPSGERLRKWMGMDSDSFCDESRIAIIPMGYCYPGKGRGGDLPPRRECATLWLEQLLAKLPRIELTLLIGRYAQHHFLGDRRKRSLTETVKAWREFAPEYLPLPHPSARNTPWFRSNPWFERELLPVLRERIKSLAAR